MKKFILLILMTITNSGFAFSSWCDGVVLGINNNTEEKFTISEIQTYQGSKLVTSGSSKTINPHSSNIYAIKSGSSKDVGGIITLDTPSSEKNEQIHLIYSGRDQSELCHLEQVIHLKLDSKYRIAKNSLHRKHFYTITKEFN